MSDGLVEDVLSYLRSHHVLTIATTGPAGAWAAAVFYVAERFELTFLSNPESRHSQNLLAQGRAAAAIHDNVEDWRDIKGVQLEGPVHTLEGTAREHAVTRYLQRFSFLEAAPTALQNAMDRVAWYRIVPDRLYYIDNSRGFGHRDRII